MFMLLNNLKSGEVTVKRYKPKYKLKETYLCHADNKAGIYSFKIEAIGPETFILDMLAAYRECGGYKEQTNFAKHPAEHHSKEIDGKLESLLKDTASEYNDSNDGTTARSSRHKQHYCFFCEKIIDRINDHLRRKHTNISAIKKILKIRNKLKRLRAWRDLISGWEERVGLGSELIRKPRKSETKKKREYFECDVCKKKITKSNKARHLRSH